MKIYHEIGRRMEDSSRADIISRGWGTTEAPLKPNKATKVEIVELTADEYAAWTAAKDRNAANLWKGFGR
jgi:hypothetical protein